MTTLTLSYFPATLPHLRMQSNPWSSIEQKPTIPRWIWQIPSGISSSIQRTDHFLVLHDKLSYSLALSRKNNIWSSSYHLACTYLHQCSLSTLMPSSMPCKLYAFLICCTTWITISPLAHPVTPLLSQYQCNGSHAWKSWLHGKYQEWQCPLPVTNVLHVHFDSVCHQAYVDLVKLNDIISKLQGVVIG